MYNFCELSNSCVARPEDRLKLVVTVQLTKQSLCTSRLLILLDITASQFYSADIHVRCGWAISPFLPGPERSVVHGGSHHLRKLVILVWVFGTLACQVQGTLCIAVSVWTRAWGLWVAMLEGKYPGTRRLGINGQWEQRVLRGRTLIMRGGLWKHYVAHRCQLPCSNLFFNLSCSLIQPVKLPDFPHVSSRLIWGSLFLASYLTPGQALAFSMLSGLYPSLSASFSCFINLKLVPPTYFLGFGY